MILIEQGLLWENKVLTTKIEDDILSDILNDKKIDFPTETDHISLPNMAEEIKQQKVNEEEMNIKALLKKLKETKKH